MNKFFLFFMLLTSFMIFSISSAEEIEKLQPCMEIKKSCEVSLKGKSREAKGAIKDCMKKLVNGESVIGVKVSSEVINSCKEKHEK